MPGKARAAPEPEREEVQRRGGGAVGAGPQTQRAGFDTASRVAGKKPEKPEPVFAHTVDTVTATIAQQPATVLFSGLAPLFAQLYQVNVQVPSGLPPGSSLVILSESGQQSAPFTVTVQ